MSVIANTQVQFPYSWLNFMTRPYWVASIYDKILWTMCTLALYIDF